MKKSHDWTELCHKIDSIPVIDAHDHLMPEEERIKGPGDVLSHWLYHYTSADLISAGMTRSKLDFIRNPANSQEERWSTFLRCWPYVKYTGFGRVLMLAAKDLFGVEGIDEYTWPELSQRYSASRVAGWYDLVLRQKARIKMVLNADLVDMPVIRRVDSSLFRKVANHLDFFITPSSKEDLELLSLYTNVDIASLNDLLRAMDTAIQESERHDAVAVKTSLAYSRTLAFDEIDQVSAENAFSRILTSQPRQNNVTFDEVKPFQDFVFHQLIKLCIDHGWPIQIHTGMLEGGGKCLDNANPMHLTNLFLRYPSAKFVLLHSGFPFEAPMTALSKTFPNVYADMSWIYVISPMIARTILSEWIETIPVNKIIGFGGDYHFVEGTYAHLVIARNVICNVLVEKISEGYLTFDDSLRIAEFLLFGNPCNIYGLSQTDLRKEVSPIAQ